MKKQKCWKYQISAINKELLCIKLGVNPNSKYNLLIEPSIQGNGANSFDAQQFSKNGEELFSGLNPSHFNFDYRRNVKVWKEYNKKE